MEDFVIARLDKTCTWYLFNNKQEKSEITKNNKNWEEAILCPHYSLLTTN